MTTPNPLIGTPLRPDVSKASCHITGSDDDTPRNTNWDTSVSRTKDDGGYAVTKADALFTVTSAVAEAMGPPCGRKTEESVTKSWNVNVVKVPSTGAESGSEIKGILYLPSPHMGSDSGK